MKKTVKQLREIFTGLNTLAGAPIANHFLTFVIKNSLTGIQPIMENLGKREEEILKEHAQLDGAGNVLRNEKGLPVWLEADSENKAVAALSEIFDEVIELPGTVKPLTWKLLEKTKCVFINKEDGTRVTEPLLVSVTVQLLLGDFIEGEPTDPDAVV